jgi:hypothetical protein
MCSFVLLVRIMSIAQCHQFAAGISLESSLSLLVRRSSKFNGGGKQPLALLVEYSFLPPAIGEPRGGG